MVKLKTNFLKSRKVAKTTSKQCIGINFTEKSINMVLLSTKSLNQFFLEKYVVVPLPKNIIDNGNIENHEDFVVFLQQAKQKLQSNCENIIVAIPQKLTSIQFFTHDPEFDYTKEEQILMRLNQYDSLDETSYDYNSIMNEENGNENLLLVSSKREDVNLLMDTFADADITPKELDVDLLAIINSAITCINTKYPQLINKSIAVFNIDYNDTQAIVLRNGIIFYKQEMSIGHEHLIRSICRNYQLTDEEAWDMLFADSKPKDYQTTVVEPFQQQFIQEIQRFLQFYFTSSNITSSNMEDEIEEIMIFGYENNHASNFMQNIREQIHISTQMINPVLLAQADNKIDENKLYQESGLLTIAFGLAVRGL